MTFEIKIHLDGISNFYPEESEWANEYEIDMEDRNTLITSSSLIGKKSDFKRLRDAIDRLLSLDKEGEDDEE